MPPFTSSISILPAGPSDAPAIIDVGMRAFRDDPVSRLIWNLDTATPEQTTQVRDWRVGMSRARMRGPGKYYFKAIDEATGEVVGFTGLNAPEGFHPKATNESTIPAPAFINHGAQAEFRARQVETHEKWLGERKDVWYVQSMAVDPNHWGKGIGKRLLRRGLEEVDEAGQDIYLEATLAAVPMYKSCGFEVLDRIEVLGDGLIMTAMIRRHSG